MDKNAMPLISEVSQIIKRCTKCGKDKPLSAFNKDKSRKKGISECCATCKGKMTRVWKEKNALTLKERAANRSDIEILKASIKTCKKCGEEKCYNQFSKDNRNKDGMGSLCKMCSNKRAVELAPKHKAKKSEQGKKYRDANKHKITTRLAEYYLTHKPVYKERSQIWRDKNPEMARAMYKRNDKKRLSTPKGHISAAMSHRMSASLRKGAKANRHWEGLVGYTVEQLKNHLEKKFTPDMTWENYGQHWHIDHKIPVAAFNYETPEDIDFKRCWALKNLQPLEAITNISKGAKLEKPFQPSLMI
jgi:hypothetical protein